MTQETGTIEESPKRALSGKLFGIVADRHQLKSLSNALAALPVGETEVLDAIPGINQIETWQEVVSHYFFGDMEGLMLQRYLDALKNNLIVFAVTLDSDIANDAAEIAKTNGATEIAHFGNLVITNY